MVKWTKFLSVNLVIYMDLILVSEYGTIHSAFVPPPSVSGISKYYERHFEAIDSFTVDPLKSQKLKTIHKTIAPIHSPEPKLLW